MTIHKKLLFIIFKADHSCTHWINLQDLVYSDLLMYLAAFADQICACLSVRNIIVSKNIFLMIFKVKFSFHCNSNSKYIQSIEIYFQFSSVRCNEIVSPNQLFSHFGSKRNLPLCTSIYNFVQLSKRELKRWEGVNCD